MNKRGCGSADGGSGGDSGGGGGGGGDGGSGGSGDGGGNSRTAMRMEPSNQLSSTTTRPPPASAASGGPPLASTGLPVSICGTLRANTNVPPVVGTFRPDLNPTVDISAAITARMMSPSADDEASASGGAEPPISDVSVSAGQPTGDVRVSAEPPTGDVRVSARPPTGDLRVSAGPPTGDVRASAGRPADGRLHVRPSERLQGFTDNAYRMMSRPRGLALIISNVHFQKPHVHPDRIGGDEDERALGWLLTELAFQVETRRNLNRDDMRAAIAAFVRREEHGVADCAVLTIMTHGEEAGLFGVDSRLIAEEEVIKLFSNPSAPLLAGKPKWLILQACRGPKLNRAFNRFGYPELQSARCYYIPRMGMSMPEFSDIFLTHSTIPGYVSWRDVDRGSWLVQALCEVFTEWAHCQHLSDLHLSVQHHIDTMPADDDRRQTVEFSVRGCTKRLYFNPGL